jgi:hypothetical protein
MLRITRFETVIVIENLFVEGAMLGGVFALFRSYEVDSKLKILQLRIWGYNITSVRKQNRELVPRRKRMHALYKVRKPTMGRDHSDVIWSYGL